MSPKLCLLGTVLALVRLALADPNDFVNPKYAVAARGDFETKAARVTIFQNGNKAAKKGPWTVTDSEVWATSNDPHDYLSWAPYHWPNCNWCMKARSTEDLPPDGEDGGSTQAVEADTDSNNRLLKSGSEDSTENFVPLYARYRRHVDRSLVFSTNDDPDFGLNLYNIEDEILDPFTGIERGFDTGEIPLLPVGEDFASGLTSLDSTPISSLSLMPTLEITTPDLITQSAPPGDLFHTAIVIRGLSDTPVDAITTGIHIHAPSAAPAPTTQSTTSSIDRVYDHSENPVRAHKPTKTRDCTTSPTTSMKPSETWKSCPYKARDGQVNPDVRKLQSPAKVVDMSQTVLWNAVGYIASGSATSAKNAASFISHFFLEDNTRMNPHAGYGQVVRGPPGTQSGSYMGVLDIRGLVKVVNAVLILREARSQYWTQDMDTKMKDWANQYLQWIEASETGKKAAGAANNHGSFYPNQIAALKILVGDAPGAKFVLQSYFDNQFQEQVVSSGEQPLEAVRTRPFHYRCFNLEAIITNAKLGDYIGVNFWDYKSKYGATIQTAVDYVMSLDPKKENIAEALPHVAAVAAAYGDPRGKYARYLKSGNQYYTKKPFWFYDQPSAIIGSAVRSGKKPRAEQSKDSSTQPMEPSLEASQVDQNHPPALFSNGRLVELEEGLFVSWEDVREFYRKRRVPSDKRRAKRLASRQESESIPSMFRDGENVDLEDSIIINWEDVEEYYERSSD